MFATVAFAGCLQNGVVDDDSTVFPDQDASETLLPPINGSEVNLTKEPLALVDLTGEDLLKNHAVVTTDPGRWTVVRLVLDPDVWSWDTYDGTDGEAQINYIHTVEVPEGSYAYVMDGTMFVQFDPNFPPSISVNFAAREELTVSRASLWTRQYQEGGGLPEAPPPHELVWLIGSPDAQVRLRLGFVDEFPPFDETQDVLTARRATVVLGDASGDHGFAGSRGIVRYQGNTYERNVGHPVERTESAPLVLPGGAAAAETIGYSSRAELPAPGTLAAIASAQEQAGPTTWKYHVDAAGPQASFEGAWLYGAPNVRVGLFGVLDLPPESVHYPHGWTQFRSGTGEATLEFEAMFTGLHNDPLLTPSTDVVNWGYADVDLASLYGWPWQDQAIPDNGGGAATAGHETCSFMVDVPFCTVHEPR